MEGRSQAVRAGGAEGCRSYHIVKACVNVVNGYFHGTANDIMKVARVSVKSFTLFLQAILLLLNIAVSIHLFFILLR